MDLFHTIGGTPKCRKLAKAFYARVGRDPVLRPFFPSPNLKCAIEEFAAFLVQFLGGPSEDSQRRWWLSLRESHRRFPLGPEHRAAWMSQMVHALDDAKIQEPARAALRDFFEHASAHVIDSAPPDQSLQEELAHRWRRQQTLDDAVAAVRNGESDRSIALAGLCDRAILPGLLAVMIRSEDDTLLAYVHQQLMSDPDLAQQRYAGRTLLHTAAAAGSLPTVELLLRLGVDPNVKDGGEHTPLYSVGNECLGGNGASVVHALVRGGAMVDANDGATRSTPLHMAARRGNALVAKALLECGADLHARDTRGTTPWQRAVNCKKVEVATLLGSYR